MNQPEGKVAHRHRRRFAPGLIAGLIPRATGVTDPDLRRGLAERECLITELARQLAQTALAEQHLWTVALGNPPRGGTRAVRLRQAETIAAYRDKYQTTDPMPLGPVTCCAPGCAHHAAASTRSQRP